MASGKRPTGVYRTRLKSGRESFRVSVTFRGRHISLGSFSEEETAGRAYTEARDILEDEGRTFDSFILSGSEALDFGKAVVLFNFRDNRIYFSNPIYVRKRYFEYYLDEFDVLTFEMDDLFYYGAHKIMRRGEHLFVADYGSQISLRSRYGIQPFAVPGRDFSFVNGDQRDYRYHNIKIINPYHGVRLLSSPKNGMHYRTVIHIRGDVTVGYYRSAGEAAVAYNKAADILRERGLSINFRRNYLEELSLDQYREIYDDLILPDSILKWVPGDG